MKRSWFLVILSLLALPLATRADGPDDQYVGIYNLIQQADALNEKGQPAQAMGKYLDAQTALKHFQNGYPTWNDKVVRYRLKYLAARIAQVSMTLPPPTATNAPGASLTNAVPVPVETAGTTAPENTSTNAPENASNNPPAPSPAPIVESHPPPSSSVAPAERDQSANPPAANAVPVPPSPEADQRIKSLQDQIQQLTADRDLLQAKLKEALAAQPPGVDPRELSKAQERILGLEKENELLKAGLDQVSNNIVSLNSAALAQAQKELAEANQKITQLTQSDAALAADRDALQARVKAPVATDDAAVALRAENAILKKEVADLKSRTSAAPKSADLNRQLLEAQSQIAALQSDKEMLSLETVALENKVKTLSSGQAPVAAAVPPALPQPPDAASAARIRELEAQRDELQKRLASATPGPQGGKSGKDTTAQIEELTQQLTALRARVGLFEARRVPYTPEELALFKLPADALVASAHASVGSASARPSANAPVMMAEAQAYYAAHDFQRAEASYLELLKDDPKNLVALANLATVEIDLGQMERADKYIQQALAVDAKDAYSLSVLGRLRLQQGRNDEALDALSRAAALDPQSPEIQNYLGITLSHKGLRGPAETALRKAIQLDPNYPSAHNNLAVVYATQTPPLLDLARWHYQKALAGGQPRNPNLEKLLEASKTASAGP
jgi:tetratricopeptide (TPR) repeat protein